MISSFSRKISIYYYGYIQSTANRDGSTMQWEHKPEPELSFEPIFSQQVSVIEMDKAVLFLVVLF